jgi:hypothetical protein
VRHFQRFLRTAVAVKRHHEAESDSAESADTPSFVQNNFDDMPSRADSLADPRPE